MIALAPAATADSPDFTLLLVLALLAVAGVWAFVTVQGRRAAEPTAVAADADTGTIPAGTELAGAVGASSDEVAEASDELETPPGIGAASADIASDGTAEPETLPGTETVAADVASDAAPQPDTLPGPDAGPADAGDATKEVDTPAGNDDASAITAPDPSDPEKSGPDDRP